VTQLDLSATSTAQARARLLHGDCLDGLARLREQAVAVDLAYLDPPFGVGVTHGARTQRGEERAKKTSAAYDDAWTGIEPFLASLSARLGALRDVLSPRATVYLHLDHRTVHEAKVAADRVFGREAFRGEIVWVPGNGARTSKAWGATHQTILVYTADDRRDPASPRWTFHADRVREPYAEGSASEHFKHVDAEGRRWRERTVMLASGPKTYRYEMSRGRRMGTVWTDCPSMAANTPRAKETTGYPHQKPESLLERLVQASSDEGDVVLDPFCGSGTTLAVAARLGRRAIGCDASPLAIETTTARLARQGIAADVERVSRL
jgi:site-specific DNA-methyltransferase (adenine-specific)